MMQPRVFISSSGAPGGLPGPVMAIGNFDGVHAGHRHILSELVGLAREQGRPSLVYTFDPHPQAILGPSGAPPRLLPLEDRIRILGELGVDLVCLEPFSRAFSERPAAWFVQQVLERRLGVSTLVVGHDFRFGKGREGTSAFIEANWPHIRIHRVPPILVDGKPLSSSRIRALVESGDVEQASWLLGRDPFLRGTVVRGDQRGRLIGFPTANLLPVLEPPMATGVYAVRSRLDDGPELQGVANLGFRPTFGDGGLRIEIHLFVPERSIGPDALYGAEMVVSFAKRLREERRFDGVEALKAQIALDVEAARGFFRL